MSQIIPVENWLAWRDALSQCGDCDVYHSAEYHNAVQQLGEGQAFLFFYKDFGTAAALPFLLRPIPNQKPILFDATTAYGYPGIVCSTKKDHPFAMKFKNGFQAELTTAFSSLGVVSFFGRTNPIFSTNWLLRDLADVITHGSTVFIDLNADEKGQLEGMTKGHKYDIRKAKKLGVEIEEDKDFNKLDEFIKIYEETMDRTGATANYFFPAKYYEIMKASLKDTLRLFHAKHEGRVVATSMFFFHQKIIQYHLSGSSPNTLKFNGVKLIIDEVRRLGTKENFSFLHLGGGVGSAEDSLYKFKCGFSKLRPTFETVRMVVNKQTYAKLAEDQLKKQLKSSRKESSKFFPSYRQN